MLPIMRRIIKERQQATRLAPLRRSLYCPRPSASVSLIPASCGCAGGSEGRVSSGLCPLLQLFWEVSLLHGSTQLPPAYASL